MKVQLQGMMTSLSPHWSTPKHVYQYLNDQYKFDFDPCPLMENNFDGLSVEWGNRNFINPPYGRDIGKWIKKAYEENLNGKLCVLLIPSRTDARWWHDYIMKAHEIIFVKGRLKFGDAKNSAPFPSVIVVYEGRYHGSRCHYTSIKF